ncbi:MAG: xanthine dehydrogenase family protein subunit M [Caldilineaceae bacterium]
MKPAPFQYYAPTTVEEALTLLADNAGDGKLLAGGQSLVPAMNFRLAQPAALIDLNGVNELAYIRADGSGLQIGAMTRQRSLERSPQVAQIAPLLAATMPHIAHTQIRNRGTLGGSLAHADPAAELPAVMVALDASFHLANLEGHRVLGAADFYQGLFTTALEPDEMLVRIDISALPPGSGWSFHEFARRHGDYAIVGVAAVVQVDANGRCTAARLVYLSVGEGPTAAPQAAAALIGATPTTEVIAAAANIAAQQDIDPLGDIHASVAYRRHLVEVLGRRALTDAFARVEVTQ